MIYKEAKLRSIYVYAHNKPDFYETFQKQCEAEGIDLEYICGELTAKALREEKSEIMYITDSAVNDCEACIVGLGENCSGNYKYIIYNLDISLDYIRLIYCRYMNVPATIMTTDNLLIREMCIDDLPQLYELYETLKDSPYIEQLYEYEEELEFTKNYIDNMYGFFQYGLWLVFLKSTGELIGRAGFEHRQLDNETVKELGYLIGKPWQHKGYGYEVASAIIRYGFEELSFEQIFLCLDKNNSPSNRLSDKLGFVEYASTEDGHIVKYINNPNA